MSILKKGYVIARRQSDKNGNNIIEYYNNERREWTQNINRAQIYTSFASAIDLNITFTARGLGSRVLTIETKTITEPNNNINALKVDARIAVNKIFEYLGNYDEFNIKYIDSDNIGVTFMFDKSFDFGIRKAIVWVTVFTDDDKQYSQNSRVEIDIIDANITDMNINPTQLFYKLEGRVNVLDNDQWALKIANELKNCINR